MRPPVSQRSQPARVNANVLTRRGVLLVEAMLSAVVIAVGLTFITRALGSQLKALQRVEEYAILRNLAQQALRTMEVDLQAGNPPRDPHDDGFFGEPYEDYQWKLSTTELKDQDPVPPLAVSRVTLSVQRTEPPAATYSVQTVWPESLVP